MGGSKCAAARETGQQPSRVESCQGSNPIPRNTLETRERADVGPAPFIKGSSSGPDICDRRLTRYRVASIPPCPMADSVPNPAGSSCVAGRVDARMGPYASVAKPLGHRRMREHTPTVTYLVTFP